MFILLLFAFQRFVSCVCGRSPYGECLHVLCSLVPMLCDGLCLQVKTDVSNDKPALDLDALLAKPSVALCGGRSALRVKGALSSELFFTARFFWGSSKYVSPFKWRKTSMLLESRVCITSFTGLRRSFVFEDWSTRVTGEPLQSGGLSVARLAY